MRRIILVLSLFVALPCFAVDLQKNPNVAQFIQQMVKKYHFNKDRLTTLFERTKFDNTVIGKMDRPFEALPWYKYRKIFLNEKRAHAGAEYWAKHRKVLEKTEKATGVPASIIVAIVGIETYYGKHTGTFPVMNTLTTLAFKYPRRTKFFKGELEQYLLLTRELKVDPMSINGSYAGAIGLPQFMPSSYRHYAIKYKGHGHGDLTKDTNDVIVSVANYFKDFGWHRNQAVAVRANVTGKQYQKLKSNKLKPNISLTKLAKYGVKPLKPVKYYNKASFIQLALEKHKNYWLGFHNFYVLSRYNPRIPYAMAVYQLSRLIVAEKKHA